MVTTTYNAQYKDGEPGEPAPAVLLHNVDAHNVSIRNIKVSKRERHITYSVTKHT
jgi:hypothetical protein